MPTRDGQIFRQPVLEKDGPQCVKCSGRTTLLVEQIAIREAEISLLKKQLGEAREWSLSQARPLWQTRVAFGQHRREQGAIQRAERVGNHTSPTLLGRALGVSRQRAEQLLHHDRHRARAILSKTIATGVIQRPLLCSRCGIEEPHLNAHHSDYTKPLEVDWLCLICHKAHHRKDGGKLPRSFRELDTLANKALKRLNRL